MSNVESERRNEQTINFYTFARSFFLLRELRKMEERGRERKEKKRADGWLD